MADGIIGNAAEFYRLRLIRLDPPGEPEFEWRDDALYRDLDALASSGPATATFHVLQAVELEDSERVLEIARTESPERAAEMLAAAEEDLRQMTRSEFEAEYLRDTRSLEAQEQDESERT